MDDLVAFLRACLEEDERVATAAAARSRPPWSFGEFSVDGADPGPLVADADGDAVAEINRWGLDVMPSELGEHIARWDPSRVLAEVEAKRGILDWYPRMASISGSGGVLAGLDLAVQHLAQPFSDRPGFKDEWRLT